MNKLKLITTFAIAVAPFLVSSQYTDVINSNRPGQSVSAYAVGKNVIQVEGGIIYEQQDHARLNTESNILGSDLSLRYGLLFERLEINWEGTYQNQNITHRETNVKSSNTNFYRNRLGLKFLVYDPFKNPENNKPNLYSWKANHRFQWRNLLPAISIYGGANFILGDNPFYVGDPTISPRAMVATQSRLTPRTVLIMNFAYDRIGTDFPEMSYIVSFTRAFRNPKWSFFLENQGIKSDRYSDNLVRGGFAYLFNETLQADFNIGTGFKDTPSRLFIGLGGSYRFDMHKDKVISIEEQKANENGGEIKKGSMKKKKKKEKRAAKKGSGAEDIDLTPSKKQLRKQRKKEKKKQKEEDNGVIDF